MFRGRRRAALTIVAIAFLSGCATPTPAAPTGINSSDSQRPDFAGPYASEYRSAWEQSGDDFVHGVLADEKISDVEWSEVGERMSVCFESKQIDFGGFSDDGGYSVTPYDRGMDSDKLNQAADECDVESGLRWIGLLRGAERMNPDNRDVFEIMADCLVTNGVVAAGYTAEDYRRDSDAETVPYLDPDSGPQKLMDCNDDPLALTPSDG